ncbi:DUF416 family protein [Alteromonas facilis]|uniref:DUF416 family protein n=1 Tax=Alteromonas facilis TaxID=2048004 RepID=UPI000C293CCE|nr:DUF416 family protein [Alteromonas facilis]
MTQAGKKLSTFAQVRALPKIAAVGFCAAMLERQVPNFSLFCQIAEVEGEAQMQKALMQVWLAYEAQLAKRKISTNFSLLKEKVEDISPDPAEHDNFGVYPAIDCAMSMIAALSLLSGEDEQGAVAVSKLSQGSVEAVILATEGEIDNDQIKQHPLMQREVAFQQALLAHFSEGSALPEADTLRQLALADAATNIGISLED